jgi:fructan beta-fructosidase
MDFVPRPPTSEISTIASAISRCRKSCTDLCEEPLCYQYWRYGRENEPGNGHTWGHAVSDDLVHWKHLPNTEIEGSSGTCVVDKGNASGLGKEREDVLVAFYGGSLSFSTDRGRTWTPYDGNPILPKHADPCVFRHAPTGEWIMLTFVWPDAPHDWLIYRSLNLRDWELTSTATLELHECPGLFELPIRGEETTRWIVRGANGEYLIGEFDGQRFVPEAGKYRMDWGNFYAPQVWSNTQKETGRTVQIAWLRGPSFPAQMSFNQQLTFPCELTLRRFPEGLRICRWPVPEIASLHESKRRWEDMIVGPMENLLEGIEGECFDIELEAIVEEPNEFLLVVRGAAIQFVPAQSALFLALEFEHAGRRYPDIYEQPGMMAPYDTGEGILRLRILVDRASIEVFADSGQTAIMRGFFPRPDDRRLALSSPGGEFRVLNLTLRRLQSAWPAPE